MLKQKIAFLFVIQIILKERWKLLTGIHCPLGMEMNLPGWI